VTWFIFSADGNRPRQARITLPEKRPFMPISRRELLGGLVVSLAAAGCGKDSASTLEPAAAQTTIPPVPPPTFLYLQSADGGSLSAQGGDRFALRLQGAATTLYFSDRPARVFGSMPTGDFVAKDFPSFGADPPNALLEIAGSAQATILELLSAALEGGDLVYGCRALPDGAGAAYAGQLVRPQGFPASFGPANLFIDNSPGNPAPADTGEISNVATVTPTASFGVWNLRGVGEFKGTVTFNNTTGVPVTIAGSNSAQNVTLRDVNVPVGTSRQTVEILSLSHLAGGSYSIPVSVRGNGYLAEGTVVANLHYEPGITGHE